ncbi:N-acetylglucosamine kinase [Actinopolymorpha pittospori]
MSRLVFGVDVGGTKTQIRLVDAQGGTVTADRTVSSSDWQASRVPEAAGWLAAQLRPLLQPGEEPLLTVVGAHGCETEEHCARLAAELQAALHSPVTVVNDAELLVPAAGLADGIAVVAGTGSVVVGRHRDTRERLTAGGWGWVLGDEGSGSALVRDAARAVLAQADEGLPPEHLEAALLRSFDVPDRVELAAVMSWNDGVETWGAHVPAVFEAAEAGSMLAREVIRTGGSSLARLVVHLARRGANADAVVVAGGVITHQPRLKAAFEEELRSHLHGIPITLLEVPPVQGAVELARRAVVREGTPADQVRSAGRP